MKKLIPDSRSTRAAAVLLRVVEPLLKLRRHAYFFWPRMTVFDDDFLDGAHFPGPNMLGASGNLEINSWKDKREESRDREGLGFLG